MKTLIIAEAGVNHNGSLSNALELIDAAISAGADIVKFQTFNAASIATANVKMAKYQRNSDDSNHNQYEMLKQLELNQKEHYQLKDYCIGKKIEFLSTGFDIESLEFLIALGIKRIKIPSGEITNLPYLRFASKHNLPIILSTGMSKMSEIEDAINVLVAGGDERGMISLLHCTSEYPTALTDVNLRAMQSMSRYFDLEIGYSDHTEGIEVALAAVAMGASIIEKHFTLDKNQKGPDHKASLNPEELKRMISGIRNIEKSLGSFEKKPTRGELENSQFIRKSLVAISPIRKGENFTYLNIGVKRPGTGISPMEIDSLMTKVSDRDYEIDELIQP